MESKEKKILCKICLAKEDKWQDFLFVKKDILFTIVSYSNLQVYVDEVTNK